MRRVQRAPLVFPLILVGLGVVILLNSFLLIDADIVALWPLILIFIGISVLWRGDLAPSWDAHTFGITRGSVESASLQISSAEIDVQIRPLDRAGRLIAGQYTARSRPRLVVRNNHASLNMNRGNTWLFSLVDWNLALAPDLSWSILASSFIGKFRFDLRGIALRKAHIGTGMGDIRIICPETPSGPIYVRSNFGDIEVSVPAGLPALIYIQASPFCRVIADEQHFEREVSEAVYATAAYVPDAEATEITLRATFGNIIITPINH